MNLSHLNPFIRYASLHLMHWNKKEMSVCYDCRLFYILQGDGSLEADDQAYTVTQNSVIFLPSGTHYRFAFHHPDDVRIYVMNFDLTDERSDLTHSIGTATEESFDPRRVIRTPLGDALSTVTVTEGGVRLHERIRTCVDLFLSKTSNYKYFASAHLKLALIELLDESRREQGDYRLVQNVQEYVRLHYLRTDLNNRTLAEAFSYHPYHISRLMKRYTQSTLHEYILNYRIHMAKVYLRTTSLSVTEIATRSGFASYSYFIKVFRERVGISPLQYRKKLGTFSI